MRILAFSDWRVQNINDIFEFIQTLDEPVDFILYGGDDIDRFKDEKTNYFTKLSEYTRNKKVLAVIGNDDSFEEKEVLRSRNVHDLYEKPLVFQNFALIGVEALTRGISTKRHTEEEIEKHLQKQFNGVKNKKIIILSHMPPYGTLDQGIRFAPLNKIAHHQGSISLKNFIQQNKVHLVICGHCHSQGGLSTRVKATTVINVSSHDSPGAKGNFALIDIGSGGQIEIKWHNTFEMLDEGSLMHLHGIGESRASSLHDIGIKTIKDLAEVKDFGKLVQNASFSEYFLKKLQLEAKSVLEKKIYQISPFTLPKGKFIFFDIETDITCKRIWLIGIFKQGEFIRFYADRWNHERNILQDFLGFLKDNQDLVLVSFSGKNFDRNVVQRALVRLGLDSRLFSSYPHIDLCQAIRGSFIFPNKSFALKDLGTHLKYPFRYPDIDGLWVALEYQRHLEENRPLDSKVLEYNEDDVRALPFIMSLIINDELKAEKIFLEKTYQTGVLKNISDELRKEIKILKRLRDDGYTLQQLANKFKRSVYYIQSRLNPRYRPYRANKSLN